MVQPNGTWVWQPTPTQQEPQQSGTTLPQGNANQPQQPVQQPVEQPQQPVDQPQQVQQGNQPQQVQQGNQPQQVQQVQQGNQPQQPVQDNPVSDNGATSPAPVTVGTPASSAPGLKEEDIANMTVDQVNANWDAIKALIDS